MRENEESVGKRGESGKTRRVRIVGRWTDKAGRRGRKRRQEGGGRGLAEKVRRWQGSTRRANVDTYPKAATVWWVSVNV